MQTKLCTKCGKEKPLNEDNFYPARPTATHKKGGWQSHCKECWRTINRLNKSRMRTDVRNQGTEN